MPDQWKFNSRTTADAVIAGQDLSDRTILVTGANAGIGYDTARALASAGAEVILACRNNSKGKSAVERIQQAHPPARVRCEQVDLGSLANVRAFCKALDAPTLDTIICNAGLLAPKYSLSPDGFESTLAACHLGHFLLVTELLPRLLKNPQSRVVVVSSESHRQPPRLNLDHLATSDRHYVALRSYGQAKLCNVLMANELQRRYSNQGLMACSLHPGTMVTTSIGSGSPLTRFAIKLASPFTKSPAQGAATSVFCATHKPAQDIGGQYLSHCRPARMSKEAHDPAIAKTLWELSMDWVSERAAA